MLSSIHQIDAICDWKRPYVAGTSKKWMKAAAPHRKRAQQLWDAGRDLFMQNLKAANSAVELIQVFERRIWEGMGIFMHINRKEPEGGYQKWVEDQVEKHGTRQFVPWSMINRCQSDETDPIYQAIDADNTHKHHLMQYEKDYNSKTDAEAEDGPMKSAKMATDDKVEDSDDESLSSGSSEDEDALKEEHAEVVKKFLGAVQKTEEDDQPLIVSDDSDVEEMTEVVAETVITEENKPRKRKTRKQKKKTSN